MAFASAFLKKLDEQIQEKHLLKHDFYQAWSRGDLSQECLKEYAIEYYHHVKAFPTYLSALHAHTEDMKTRQGILQNLVEEELESPNHPEMWKSFALNMGATEEEIEQHTPCNAIQTLIQTFRAICSEGKTGDGLAALYAYESQIPAICISKIEGLKEHYGLCHSQQWRYFSVHIAADEEHAKVERELMVHHVSPDEADNAHQAAQRILDALWNFLSHMCHKHQIAC